MEGMSFAPAVRTEMWLRYRALRSARAGSMWFPARRRRSADSRRFHPECLREQWFPPVRSRIFPMQSRQLPNER